MMSPTLYNLWDAFNAGLDSRSPKQKHRLAEARLMVMLVSERLSQDIATGAYYYQHWAK